MRRSYLNAMKETARFMEPVWRPSALWLSLGSDAAGDARVRRHS